MNILSKNNWLELRYLVVSITPAGNLGVFRSVELGIKYVLLFHIQGLYTLARRYSADQCKMLYQFELESEDMRLFMAAQWDPFCSIITPLVSECMVRSVQSRELRIHLPPPTVPSSSSSTPPSHGHQSDSAPTSFQLTL